MLLNVVMLMCQLVCLPQQSRQLTTTDWKSLQTLLPTLNGLTKIYVNEAILKFLAQIERSILTHGAVLLSSQTMNKTKKMAVAKKPKNSKLVQEIRKDLTNINRNQLATEVKVSDNKLRQQKQIDGAETSSDDDSDDEIPPCKGDSVYNPKITRASSSETSTPSGGGKSNNVREVKKSTSPKGGRGEKTTVAPTDFTSAMEEMCSPMVPMRGHSLVAFTKLIDARDPETIQKKDVLISIIEHCIKDTDSYVYLSAVEAFAALCAVAPEEVSVTGGGGWVHLRHFYLSHLYLFPYT